MLVLGIQFVCFLVSVPGAVAGNALSLLVCGFCFGMFLTNLLDYMKS